jgi:hypothetical protein
LIDKLEEDERKEAFLKCKITLTFNNFLFSRFCYKWIVAIKEKVNMGFIDNRLSARVYKIKVKEKYKVS